MSFTPQGVSFDGKHSYTDFGLWMLSRPDLGSPTPKLSIVDIPGADGNIDLTEANTGEVKYNNRTITLAFGAVVEADEQEEFRTNIMNYLHGKRISKIVLDEDPEWYWTGRASVTFDQVRSWRLNCTVTIDASPYAMSVSKTFKHLTDGTATTQNIQIGNDVSTKEWNTDIRLGTKDFPDGLPTASQQNLIITWPEGATVGILASKTIQVIDADGNFHTHTFTLPQTDNTVTIPFSTLTSDGVDVAKVYRILVSGIGGCVASVKTTSIKHTFRNAKKSVIPEFGLVSSTPSNPSSVTIIVNGVEFVIPPGNSQNYDIVLVGGENTIYINSLPADVAELTMVFQEGKL
jgi:hypothetical protein